MLPWDIDTESRFSLATSAPVSPRNQRRPRTANAEAVQHSSASITASELVRAAFSQTQADATEDSAHDATTPRRVSRHGHRFKDKPSPRLGKPVSEAGPHSAALWLRPTQQAHGATGAGDMFALGLHTGVEVARWLMSASRRSVPMPTVPYVVMEERGSPYDLVPTRQLALEGEGQAVLCARGVLRLVTNGRESTMEVVH